MCLILLLAALCIFGMLMMDPLQNWSLLMVTVVHIAVGLNNSEVQLWDSTANRQLRTLRGAHQSRVGSLAWNNQILTMGGMDGRIVNNDVRIRSHILETYRGHTQEVCGLKWSASGNQLSSAGNDNLLHRPVKGLGLKTR